MRQVSEGLARRGHDVTVATTRLPERAETEIDRVRIVEFEIAGNAVRGMRGEVERYRRFLIEGEFDLMMNYAAQQWATDIALPLLEDLPYSRVLAPCGFSGLYDPRYRSYFRELPTFLRRYDHLIFHSHSYRDTRFAEEHGIGNFTVIPNGAAAEEFDVAADGFRERHGLPRDVPLLLTVGSHTGIKGHAAAIEAFHRARIGPAVLVVIGNGKGCLPDCRRRSRRTRLLSLGRKRVLLLDPPRAEVVAAYKAADLFLFASSVECSPIVLFEAMASRTPFLTVACGNAHEIASWSGGGVVVPTWRRHDGRVDADPHVIARHIEELVGNPARMERLAEAGHRAWRERFTWERIAGRYEEIYRSLVGAPAARLA